MRQFRTITKYLREHRAKLLWGLLFIVLTNIFQILVPRVLAFAVDHLEKSPDLGVITTCALGIVGLTVLRGIFQFLMRRTIIGVSRRIESSLREEVFEHLERLSPSYFDRMKIGDIMNRATSDLEAVRMVVGPGFMYLSNTLCVLPLSLAMMFSMSPKLALISIVPLVLLSIATRSISPRLHRYFKKVQEDLSSISAQAQESFSGVRVVKAFHREPDEIREFHRLNQNYLEANLSLARNRGILMGAIEALSGVGLLIVLWVGGREILAGRFTLGDFVAFNSYQLMLLWPMIAMGWVLSMLQRGVASMERINGILHEVPEIADGPSTESAPAVRGEIEFRDLTFAYAAGKPVLRGIRLHVEKGSTIAIVGRTGSGKSTLVSLIPRLLSAPPRTLFIDGRPIETIPLETLRGAIGCVPQETFLFSDTLRENIALGEDGQDLARLERVAAVAGIRETIHELPKGYEQVIGERGVTLSGGQKQRVTLARALHREPAILILDDCLSAVDTETEEEILRELRPVMKGRTCLLISHRITTVRHADRIVVLDQGEIVEDGKHDDLIRRRGIYAEMYRLQQLEQELERL